MGKSILELFKTAKLEELNTTPGVPFTGKGTTVEEKYQVRDSKDIKVSSSDVFMTLPFYAYNKLRTIPKERKSESFLEEEFFGLRTLRGIASPIIYGTDLIRLKLQTTPDIEEMRQANFDQDLDFRDPKNDGSQTSSQLSKFGQKIKETRDETNKFLGLPSRLNPTKILPQLIGEYYVGKNDISTNEPFNKMERLAAIKGDATGTVLGRFLKETGGGTPQQIATQAVGNAVKEIKGKVREKLIGDAQKNVTNGISSEILLRDYRRLFYSQLTPYSSDITTNLNVQSRPQLGKSRASGVQNSYILGQYKLASEYKDGTTPKPFPNYYDYFDSKNSKPENAVDRNNLREKYSFVQKFFPPTVNEDGTIKSYEKAYTKISDSPTAKFGTATSDFQTQDYNNDIIIGNDTDSEKGEYVVSSPGKGIRKNVYLQNIRPTFLKNKKKGDNKIGYSKPVDVENEAFVQNENVKSLNSNPNKESLEKRRGIGSHFDILNQTGRFTSEELKGDKNGKYGDIPLNELDLIPIRFQKVNDGSAVYMRATITNFQESIKPNWETANFVGNPFKFYTYTGVERTISFDLTAYATSQLELIMMWRRLDFLGKLAYPAQYTEAGVEPTVFYFTLGNIYVDRLGIVTSINYSLDDDKSIWEIGGDDAEGKFRAGNSDKFSNVNTSWNGTFSIGGEQLGWENDSEEIWSKVKRDGIENDGYGYAVLENSEAKEENSKNKVVYLTMNNTKVDMNKYKLPRYLKASFEITLLESKNSTFKLYDYGKTITRSAI